MDGETLLASPAATFAAQAVVTLIAVVVGAVLGGAMRSGIQTRSQKTNAALSLFNEFHSPDFIARRHAAFDKLEACQPGGFVAAIAAAKDAQEEALLSSVIHFYEKIAILWRANHVDKRLLSALLGRYVQFYEPMLFAEDGSDLDDTDWGDLMRTLKSTFADMTRLMRR